MNKVVSTENADHYRWGSEADGWHLLATESLSVIEERVPAGGRESRHYHSLSQQFFYILSGEAEMELAGEVLSLAAGNGIHVAAGVPHRFMNNSDSEVRFLVISQPRSHGDRVDT